MRIKIKYKISLLVIFSILVSISIVALWTLYSYEQTIQNNTLNELQSVSKDRASEILRILELKIEQMNGLAGNVQLQKLLELHYKIDSDTSYTSEFNALKDDFLDIELKEFMGSAYGSHQYNIWILDNNGKVVLTDDTDNSKEGFEKDLEKDFSKDPRFIRGLKESFYFIESTPESSNGLSVVMFVPIYEHSINHDRIIGVLISEYDPIVINQILEDREHLGESGETYLVNNQGYLVSNSRFIENAPYNAKVQTDAVVNCFQNNQNSKGLWPDYRGIPVMGASDCIQELGFLVLSEIDYEETQRPLIKARQEIIVFSGMIFSFMAFMSIFLSQKISKPIIDLIKASEKIATGNYDEVIKKKSDDEIGQLALQFNKMREEIKNTQQKLHDLIEEKTTDFIESEKERLNILGALDNTNIVAITDKDGTITYANKKFCDISKYSKEELIGQNHRILKSGFHDATFYQNMWKTISSGNIWHGDIKNKAKDGTFYWVRTTITPFLGKDGKPEQYIAVRTDITELYAQKDMIQLQFQELKKIDVQKDEFATMISHELKTPLVPIKGYAELLKTPDMKMTSEQLECVNEIYTNAERLESLISDVLDVQKIALGWMKFNKTKLDLKEFFTRIATSSAPLLSEKQIHLDVSPTDITIDADENRLHQVFDNLIRNAVDFVPNGGIISIGAKSQKDDVMFFVKDNGSGIPKDKQKDLFKKFYQVDSSYTRAHGGTGLGLVICKGIVENMDGKIWMESEEGKGTVFYFTIPLKSIEKKLDKNSDDTQETGIRE